MAGFRSSVGIVRQVRKVSYNVTRPFEVDIEYTTSMANSRGCSEVVKQKLYLRSPVEVGAKVYITIQFGD